MKYPVIYIKGRGNHTARFTELTEGQMRIAGDIGAAMGKLMPLKDDHAFILYEQQGEEDIRSIRFLRSWFPGAGIVLITSGRLTGEERRAYLGAGVNSAVPGDISRADFLRTLQFMTDYTFVRKPVAGAGNEVRLFRMPLWKRAFDIAASLAAILLLSPLLIAVAVAVRLDSPGPVIYKSKRVGSNYRIFDFLKFRSMRSDADRRLKELEDLNQYASAPAAEDDAKMVLDDEEIRKLLADTENGMLYADDFVIPEEAHQHQLETEQENAFVKIENDPRITRLGRFLRKYSIDELPQLFNILRSAAEAKITSEAQYRMTEVDFVKGKLDAQTLSRQKSLENSATREYEQVRRNLNDALLRLEILTHTPIINKPISMPGVSKEAPETE